MRISLFLLFGITIFWHNPAVAKPEWHDYTQTLPQYCKDLAKSGYSAEFNKWQGTLGEAYIHTHHYCNGIYAENKARMTIGQQRKRWLRSVKGEMAYVSRHCSVKCVHYPDLHRRWGWALAEDGQQAEAIRHFQLAIQAKPKYTSAYAELSDVYLELNQPNEARNILELGLKAKPESRMLQRRLRELEAR